MSGFKAEVPRLSIATFADFSFWYSTVRRRCITFPLLFLIWQKTSWHLQAQTSRLKERRYPSQSSPLSLRNQNNSPKLSLPLTLVLRRGHVERGFLTSWATSFCTLPVPQVKQKRQTPLNDWDHVTPNHRTRLKTVACNPSPQEHPANRLH